MAIKQLTPRLTLDLVIFSLREQELCLLLTQRTQSPFAQQWALPATEMDTQQDLDLESAVQRHLKNLLAMETPYLEQVQTLGNLHRDPRGWSVTIVYYSLVSYDGVTDSLPKGMKWLPISAVLKSTLAFDHQHLIASCWQRFQNKSLYTSLPIFLLPAEFTLTELQKVYEAILGFKMEKKSFRRRLLDAGCLSESGNIRRANHRPAQLYRLAQSQPYFFSRIIEGARENKQVE